MDWYQVGVLALGSGVTAGVVNNVAGGIRDKLTRSGAARASDAEREEARKARREKANEEARSKTLRVVITTRNWVEQKIWDHTENEDGDPVNYLSDQETVGDIQGALDAIMTVSMHHPSPRVRRAARELASGLEEERDAVLLNLHEAQHADRTTYELWLKQLDNLIDEIHDVRGHSN